MLLMSFLAGLVAGLLARSAWRLVCWVWELRRPRRRTIRVTRLDVTSVERLQMWNKDGHR